MEVLNINNIDLEKRKKLLSFHNKNFLKSQWSENFFSNIIKEKKRTPIGYVAEINGEIAGIILGRANKREKKEFNLLTLLVEKNYRGKGVADILMNKLIAEVKKENKFVKIYLHFRSNKFEIFYEKFGFNNFQKDGTYSNGEIKYYMELNL